ncbi:MAG: outer membrane protein assembly factor BamC [Rubrivivax sp.]
MNRFPAATAARRAGLTRTATVLAVAAALSACSSSDGLLSGDKVDYRSSTAKTKPLDVPPDLTQLSRDSRYQTQNGVVSAAGSAGAGAPTLAGAPAAAVAVQAKGELRIERQGNTRWLVSPQTPEQLWPQLKAFWTERGLALATENAEAGVMETEWAENRAKLPQDIIRSTLGRFIGGLYDSGERDLYRTRLERTPNGTEIFISHRGLEEVAQGDRGAGGTAWRARPADPSLEAEMLSRLMAKLAPTAPAATAVAAAAAAVAGAPESPARARVRAGVVSTVEVDENFDRAWRRVGLVLDRSGFTVEDRDRTAGTYFVRYVDPKMAGKEEPGFFSRLFGETGTAGPAKYRITVKADGAKTLVAVLDNTGNPASGEAANAIVTRLVNDLR